MQRNRHRRFVALVGVGCSLLLWPIAPAHSQFSLDIRLPAVAIGPNVPVYPDLILVPGYPVYYDPRASSNYFYYDGLYWVYQGDSWYASSWYDGPWQMTAPEDVPLFVLRVPVRYYRQPPAYFVGWRLDAPPRWEEHWGRGWGERRAGWDRWDRRAAPAPAALPAYQRRYSGSAYPRAPEQQLVLRGLNDHDQSRNPQAQQHSGEQGKPGNARAEPQRQAQPPSPRQPAPVAQQHAQPQPAHPAHPAQAQQSPRPAQPEKGRGHGGGNEEHGQEHR
jgi:hypothetical protein